MKCILSNYLEDDCLYLNPENTYEKIKKLVGEA